MEKRNFGATWSQLDFELWYKSEPVRNLKMILASMKATNKNYLMKSSHDGMTIGELVDSYLKSNEKGYKNYTPNVNKKNQPRYGEYFIIYIGRNINVQQQAKLVGEFIRQVTYGERSLPYVAYNSVRGDSVWIHLWIGDREYMKDEPKLYTRDYYLDADGKTCGPNTSGAVKVRSKGDVQRDKNGEPIMTNGWRQKKTRIFVESYETVRPRLMDMLVAVYYKVFRTMNITLKYRSKHHDRLVINRFATDWKNTKYREIASLQYYIRNVIHRLLVDDIDNYKLYEPDAYSFENYIDPPTPYGQSLMQLFNTYKKIFKEWKFTDKYGNEQGIMTVKYPEAMFNLYSLRKQFKQELNDIVKQYNSSFANLGGVI